VNDAELKAHADKFVAELLAKGMLSTPAMRQAVEACVAHAHRFGGCTIPEMEACTKAGRAILAERAAREKTEPRWRAEERSAGGWVVTESWDFAPQSQVAGVAFTKFTLDRINHLTESQARAVAEALNREARP